MDKKGRVIYYLQSGLFILMLLVPAFFTRIKQDENLPKYNVKEFPKTFEIYFNENLGFKKELIRAYYYLKIKVLHDAPKFASGNEKDETKKPGYIPVKELSLTTSGSEIQSPTILEKDSLRKKTNEAIRGAHPVPKDAMESHKIIPGKQGWIYYAPNDDGNGIDDYLGKIQLTQEELLKIKTNLEIQNNWLKEKNITYLLIICPNKQTIYPEYFPSKYKRAESTVIDQITNYLKNNSEINFLDLRATLKQAKKKTSHFLYYKTDTHWNNLGAFYAYLRIIQKLSEKNTALKPLDISQFSIQLETIKGQDISEMVGLSEFYEDISVVMKKKTEKEIKLNSKLVVFMDSYFNALRPLFEENYQKVITETNWEPFNYKIIEEEKPEVVIYELTERYLNKLLRDNPAPPPAQ